ncbi:hypothetical protein KL86DPRO_10098 [uncultured delta proteobacterium]|uniref:Uncharacterized protein n=1 Tax=uncultured delta proteobacterium TaxID=34034 RepID=A0A212IUH7_9DELT|nr:hypothetical protein KL86DPRO_10098 [uncultured delta proteobacterium]
MLEYFRFKEIHDLYTSGQTEDARHQLSELQARYVNLCDENAVLRKQIQGYEDILYLSRSLIFDGIFFWLVTGSIKQGPFCPVCYNRDGLLLRLTDDGASRHCLTCGSRFKRTQTPAEKPLPRQAVSGMAQGEALVQPIPSIVEGGGLHEHKRRATVIPFAAPVGR